MKALDFNKVKKQYLSVTFADEKGTTILIGTPSKAILDSFMQIKESLDNTQGEPDQDMINDLYDLCARIMSRNKTGYHVTVDFLSEIFDIEDIVIFITAYAEFIEAVTKAKNY